MWWKLQKRKKPWISDETLRYLGIPTNKNEWADYLDDQSTLFGVIGIGAAQAPVYGTAAGAAFSVVSMAAQTGSRMLRPPPTSVLFFDAASDIISSKLPGGATKDVAIELGKIIYSNAATSSNEEAIKNTECNK